MKYPSLRGATATKNPASRASQLDCFAALAMTHAARSLSIVTTGLDPVVHADVQRAKQSGESQQARIPYGLPVI
jgi:hypothetical protein